QAVGSVAIGGRSDIGQRPPNDVLDPTATLADLSCFDAHRRSSDVIGITVLRLGEGSWGGGNSSHLSPVWRRGRTQHSLSSRQRQLSGSSVPGRPRTLRASLPPFARG